MKLESTHGGITADDCEILAKTYLASPPLEYELRGVKTCQTDQQFVNEIDWRVYTEWCMDGYEGAKGDWHGRYKYREYNDIAPFNQWIALETHLALERLLKKEPQEMNHALYVEMHIKVLQAAAKRAMELFSDWKGYWTAPKDDPRNLRASLEPHL